MSEQQPNNLEIIEKNLLEIKQQMLAAYQNRNVEAEAPKLLAVTKYAEPQWVEALYQLGHRDFGESRPQQLVKRFEQYPQLCRKNNNKSHSQNDVCWHLIGQLQRNKIKSILGKVACIHSVNSTRLLEQIEHLCDELQISVRVLLQVNLSGESNKQGFSPDEVKSASFWESESKFLSIDGLMTMAARDESSAQTRTTFRCLRELRNEIQQKNTPRICLNELSMGMSGDYEIAIEEGATIVRIGSGLFQNCVPRDKK